MMFWALARSRLSWLVAGAVALAWANRFVQDDAYISFSYARNLAEGHGLVWNVDERVEGYTNFLWTVCLVPAWLLGVDPVLFSQLLSLAALMVTLFAAYRLALTLGASRDAGLLSVFLLATNYTFSCYATGGLETQFVTAWIVVAAWQLACGCRKEGDALTAAAVAGAASACAVLTRMDAVLLLVPFWAWRVASAWTRGGVRACLGVAVGCGVAALPVLLWLVWRHGYYGEWVPNTFLVKSSGPTWFRGAYYVGLFYAVYGLWLVIPGWLRVWRGCRGKAAVWAAGAACVAWHGYVVLVGGDFMEFRMLVPVLPLVFTGVAVGVMHGWDARWVRAALVVALVAFSALHAVVRVEYPGIQAIAELKACRNEWEEVAEALARDFGTQREHMKIAVTAAGIIPYITRCRTVDLLGLNDRGIALGGERVEPVSRWLGNRPGHVVIASREMVRARGVHLVFNKPWVTDAAGLEGLSARKVCEAWNMGASSDTRRVHPMRVRYGGVPDSEVPRVVAWPMGDGRYVMSLYERADPVVDAAITRCGARVVGERR